MNDGKVIMKKTPDEVFMKKPFITKEKAEEIIGPEENGHPESVGKLRP